MSDELVRAYGRVYAIRQEANDLFIHNDLCADFDAQIDRIQAVSGADLSEYKIGDVGRDGNRNYHYSDRVRARIDGYLNYLRMSVPAEQTTKIGFQ